MHVMMAFVVVTLHVTSLVERFFKQDLFGLVCKGMYISSVNHVMHASVLAQGGEHMNLVSLSLLLVPLKSGELML